MKNLFKYPMLVFASLSMAFTCSSCSDGSDADDPYVQVPGEGEETEASGSGDSANDEAAGDEAVPGDSGHSVGDQTGGDNPGGDDSGPGSGSDSESTPEDLPLLQELILENEELAQLRDALQIASDIEVLLEDPAGNFTVFAPTNNALNELFETLGAPYHEFSDFESPVEREAIGQLVAYHVAPLRMAPEGLAEGEVVTLLSGENLRIGQDATGWYVMDGFLRKSHLNLTILEASNGYIYLIDQILVPEIVQDFLF